MSSSFLDIMQFQIVRDSIIDNVFGPAEKGRFQTTGFQRQGKSALEVLGYLREITTYYHSGDFPESAGSNTGTSQHDCSFRIELSVSMENEANLEVINDPGSSVEQIGAAIQASADASFLADRSMDELIAIAYQILMDPRNYDLGLSPGAVADRRISRIQKDDIITQGEYVVLTASMLLSCRVAEDVVGDTGRSGNFTIETVIEQPEDDVTKTGITVAT